MVDCTEPDLLTKRKHILSEMIGDTIVGLEKYCVMDEAYIKSNTKDLTKAFSVSGGPYLMYLSSGLTIGVLSITEHFALNLWTEAVGGKLCKRGGKLSTKKSFFVISAKDPTYSSPEYANLLGKQINGLVILKSKKDLFAYRPSEVGLKIILNDGVFLFSHYLTDNWDENALIFENQIDRSMLEDLHEIAVGAQG